RAHPGAEGHRPHARHVLREHGESVRQHCTAKFCLRARRRSCHTARRDDSIFGCADVRSRSAPRPLSATARATRPLTLATFSTRFATRTIFTTAVASAAAPRILGIGH